jgi:hypothetical protein
MGRKPLTPPMDMDADADVDVDVDAMDIHQSMELANDFQLPQQTCSDPQSLNPVTTVTTVPRLAGVEEGPPVQLDTSFDFASVLGFLTPELTPPSSHSMELWETPDSGCLSTPDPLPLPAEPMFGKQDYPELSFALLQSVCIYLISSLA